MAKSLENYRNYDHDIEKAAHPENFKEDYESENEDLEEE